ncbi:sensor histidine kinase [Leptothoe spongobia]|uniref:histidine kinase n=1 Tax=Leptothoe spongobia TAU-MAC 1115 TaxID=1967444 RepID=A0A947GP34_9CYAN|nr:ATP-binding protein [Leptothoe spongobia]MBT9316346.1 HAMP domain-containing protein [Leptothoe spongobia TAU-MAC 1115]
MVIPLSRWIAGLSRRLGINRSISKKISCGYALALGTAIFGTSAGLLGGYYAAFPARKQAKNTLRKKQLLSEFNNHVLSIQLHPQRLLAIAGESRIWVQYETNQFNTELRQLRQQLGDIEQLPQDASSADTQRLSLIDGYELNLQEYERFIQYLWLELGKVNNQQIALQTIAVALSSDEAHQISTTFEQLSEDLTRLQQTVDRQYNYSIVYRHRAEKLRLVIILGSMVFSIGLAISLAMITSRAIAEPIEQLTLISRRVTQDNNFQLRVSIQTQDEVSVLAESLNQLVSWAGQYTRELEEARQTLEQRVVERTQALQRSELSLRKQAEDLQQALVELQQTQLQLVQSEKMSGLGQLVAGIAHEINNPISFIHCNLKYAITYIEDVVMLLDLYQHYYPDPIVEIQDAIEYIDLPFLRKDFSNLVQAMQEGTVRIIGIVKSLRTFSCLDEATIKQVDIHDGIDSTLTILNSRIASALDQPEIEVVRDYGQLPCIECYAGQLNQVFMHILSNAIDVLRRVPPEGIARVAIATRVVDSKWVSIEISDNGPGIPESLRSRLFDPFYTTKSVGSGTGMGLSISHQIITKTHRGYLDCDSDLGQGAKFTIKLPIELH